MNHAMLLPILLPLFCGGLLVVMPARWRARSRWLGVLATLALLPISAGLVDQAASGNIAVYAVGNWAAPFGIVLQVDR
ncbi:monovalent cation/H+ antiporter subunit D, partial [Acinetobacter baumannii]